MFGFSPKALPSCLSWLSKDTHSVPLQKLPATSIARARESLLAQENEIDFPASTKVQAGRFCWDLSILGSVLFVDKMGWDGPVPVFWDGMIPVPVWLKGWDNPCFLFGWRVKVGWNHPAYCLVRRMEVGQVDVVTSLSSLVRLSPLCVSPHNYCIFILYT